jgi:mannose-6-phosphate isomerase-like protein (cupin superfamily)
MEETLVSPRPTIRHAGEGKSVHAFGSEALFMLTAEDSEGKLTLGFSIVPPGGGPPPHRQLAEDELFIIVEGRYSILTTDRWTEVGPGAVVYLPRGTLHTFRNVGDTPSRHWVLTTHSGFETFYARCAEVFAPGGPPDFKRLAEISREHGIEFVPPGAGDSHGTN